MALISPADAESVRNRIRQCNLPRPLNIFLFGFDPVRPEEERLTAEPQPAPVQDGPEPRKRGPKPESRRISYDEIRQRVESWVAGKDDFMDEVSLEDLAIQTNLYKTHLLKYFRHCEHKDFRYWKMEKKIELARRLLLDDPDRPVADIAVRAGFNNAANYFRQFRRVTGCTPAQWREEPLLRNGQD
ncbi:MAG: AraC family transcriptional regulator [Bacteroidales bacterium]|nr:AraC family transcriptional regulator [Bacteroidales bacterium]